MRRPCAHEAGAGRAIAIQAAERREHQRHTYGALDLGTNNCRLLIARPTDGGFTVVDAFSRIVRLGEGLAQSGKLTDDAMDRAVAALAVCADKLRRRNVSLSRSVATEACRRARQRPRVRRAGARARPASRSTSSRPQEEARLAVLGCHKLLEPGDGPALIFDIGGGSTELVLVDQDDGVPAHPQLVERAVGRRFADRERGPRRRSKAATGSPPTSACASAPATPSAASPTCCPRTRDGHPPARHQRHGDHARQRPSRAAQLRPPRGRRAARADRGDAEDQHA